MRGMRSKFERSGKAELFPAPDLDSEHSRPFAMARGPIWMGERGPRGALIREREMDSEARLPIRTSLVSVKGIAAGGDLGAADHPGWALADEIEAATFTNLLMLGFDPALMERKHATSFHLRMFRKTNAKGMEIVLHLLI